MDRDGKHKLDHRLATGAAAVVVLSTCDFLPGIPSIPGRAGLHWAALLTVVLWIVAFKVRRLNVTLPIQLIVGLVAPVAAYALTAIVHGELAAWAETARVAVVLSFFVLLLSLADHSALRNRLSQAAAALVGVSALLWIAGLLLPLVRPTVFELGDHHNTGVLPRFHGYLPNPFSFGIVMLVCAGLLSAGNGWLSSGQRRWASGGALVLTALSLSFATVALPVLVAMAGIKRRRLRWLAVAGLSIAALAILFTVPLKARILGQEATIGARHDNDGGARQMPVVTVGGGPLEVDVVLTRYAVLGQRAAQCLVDNPVVGVGGRGFSRRCRVWQMAPAGTWHDRSRSHSQYGGIIAETGMLGVLAALLLVWGIATSGQVHPGTPVTAGVIAAYLLCGFAGDNWFLFPFAALLGSSLGPRPPQPGPTAPS